MPSEKSKNNFVPEFGPNGAVMNSPHMTDEVRDKIKKPWFGQKFVEGRTFFVQIFIAIMFTKYGYEIAKRYPNVSEEQADFLWFAALVIMTLFGAAEFCWRRFVRNKKRANQE
ncbi:hypothetical protein [Hirschia baltica]|uniref:Uncharacterized protein n=1 Tax=Hirschia baltica (strain ATCC 49814 / DSM 5838 / IFAM 1418) TaxID=582402 RepID=C6XMI8_HIRBI|nr:hypothetical protein [Hirschia baltica]ACT58131.1 hypothetical protein Hbal_0429 [Hirschia baltica ATCC 49814]